MKNTCKTKLKAAFWVVVGLVFLTIPFWINYFLVSFGFEEHSNNLYILLINNVFPSLATMAFMSGAWEALNKKSFAKEVLELSQVSDNYVKSGIIHVYNEFTDIDWMGLFKNAHKVVFFFTYAYSWRSNNRTALKLLEEQKTDITVILPDYTDDKIVDSLDRHFHYGQHFRLESHANKSTKELIADAQQFFEGMGATVKLYSGDIKSTYYLIDDKCVFAPFKHGQSKTSVPAILCKDDGTFFDFCKKDIDALIKESKSVGASV